MSSLLCSHDLEQYSVPVMRLLCVRGTILGTPVVPPVGPIWATCMGSGRLVASRARLSSVNSASSISFSRLEKGF